MISKQNMVQFVIALLLSIVICNSESSVVLADVAQNQNAPIISTESTPESIIASDIKAQQQQDYKTYLAIRSTNEVATECQSIISAIQRNQPENDVMKDVVSAELSRIKSIPNNIASNYTNMCQYNNTWKQVKAYYVAINYKVSKENRWFYNGVNYRLYILALENNHWVIVEVAMAPTIRIVSDGYGFDDVDEQKALNILRTREKSGQFVNPSGQVIENISATTDQLKEEKSNQKLVIPSKVSLVKNVHSCPSSIRVYRTATRTVQTINFYSYLKNVLPNEWPPSWNTAPLETGAMACKMYGWYYVYYPHSSSYDVKDDTNDQVYSPNSENANTTQAINNVGGTGFERMDDSLFVCHHWAGYYDEGRSGPSSCPTDGWVWQQGTRYWDDESGGWSSFWDLMLYYYDNSDSSGHQSTKFFSY